MSFEIACVFAWILIWYVHKHMEEDLYYTSVHRFYLLWWLIVLWWLKFGVEKTECIALTKVYT